MFYYIFVLFLPICQVQMRKYRAQAGNVTETAQVPQTITQLSEAEAMFSRHRRRTPQGQTVEEELNGYIADPTFATSMLIYWQVCHSSKLHKTQEKLTGK